MLLTCRSLYRSFQASLFLITIVVLDQTSGETLSAPLPGPAAHVLLLEVDPIVRTTEHEN